ncbi:MAG: UDP-N-acetylmuramate dehydrogenase [Bacteroidetes bacterium]|nr:UDP-N-acetylmuramate dehydrogenase [Bacteroidota bacterium]
MQVLENISLKPYNTFGIDVKAKYFAVLHSDNEIAAFFSALTEERMPYLVLGGGSNVLFTKDFDGSVACIRSKGIVKLMEDENYVYLKIAAGEVWDDVVNYAVGNGLGGIENLSLIPGNAGTGPVQNIGAYGVELKDVLYSVEVADVIARHYRAFRPADCEFGYRKSIFKNQGKSRFVITSLCLKLDKHPVLKLDYGDIRKELEKAGIKDPTISAVRDVIIKIRSSKIPDPSIMGNAGSFFMNPVVSADEYARLIIEFPVMPSFKIGEDVKIPGAWLIEQCGFKGKRFGNAGVHKDQPLVLVNYGSATGVEILVLAEKIIDSVQEKFGIRLEKEVNIF